MCENKSKDSPTINEKNMVVLNFDLEYSGHDFNHIPGI